MGKITSNYPLSDLRDKIQGFSTPASRDGHSLVFGKQDHINAACCECGRCRERRDNRRESADSRD